jgi:sulfate adenylyltransferase
MEYPSITLEDRYLCDLEMLLLGAFNPLQGFLNENDYNSVVENCKLSSGQLWTMPIVLPIHSNEHEKFKNEPFLTLRDKTGLPIATLQVESRYKPNLIKECQMVYGTDDDNHPYVKIVLALGDVYYYGGKINKIIDVKHYDFIENRWSAEKTKQFIKDNQWDCVVGFQTRNPMHRSHFELTKYALQQTGNKNAKLLLTPVVGITQPCDVNYHVRTRCYQKLIPYYENNAQLVLLPLSMRMAGPREAVWHAQIRKNYGCTHFIVGRDHAGPSYKKKDGTDFYGPYDAHILVEKYKNEIGLQIILSQMIVYVGNKQCYLPMDKVEKGDEVLNISGTEQRRLLKEGLEIPEWFTFPEIVEELRCEFKPLNRRGLCIYFTGLSGSGKSTLANYIQQRIMQNEKHRNITLLDADIVRTHLSKGLGFSKNDRSTNVRRIGYVCSEIVKHSGIVLVANIAPYKEDRDYNREIISNEGNYIEVFVDTTLQKCEERDVKGLYALARKGVIKEFTGISDPYEIPNNPEIIVNGADDLDFSVNKIMLWLQDRELI